MNRRQLCALLAALPFLNGPRPLTLATVRPNTTDDQCRTIADYFLAEIPGFSNLRGLIIEAVRYLARTSSPQFKKESEQALISAMILLPYIRPELAHWSRDVMELRDEGSDHALFHQPENVPIEAVRW